MSEPLLEGLVCLRYSWPFTAAGQHDALTPSSAHLPRPISPLESSEELVSLFHCCLVLRQGLTSQASL